MPRSIAEVNAIRRSNPSLADTIGSAQQPAAGHVNHHGYDPNQPRVPAGHRDGGQWTSEPFADGAPTPNREVVFDDSGEEAWESVANSYRSDGTLSEQEVVNRDRSRIVSQFSR